MAEHRMMSKQLLDSKQLDKVSDGAFRLYVQLCMNADDDGFINNAERITLSFERTEEELNELWESGLLLKFTSGVYVITHWRVHNQLQKDRYNRTNHIEEMKLITWDNSNRFYRPAMKGYPNGLELIADWFKGSKYQLTVFDKLPPQNVELCIQDVYKVYTQISTVQDRLVQHNLAERSEARDLYEELNKAAEIGFGN